MAMKLLTNDHDFFTVVIPTSSGTSSRYDTFPRMCLPFRKERLDMLASIS